MDYELKIEQMLNEEANRTADWLAPLSIGQLRKLAVDLAIDRVEYAAHDGLHRIVEILAAKQLLQEIRRRAEVAALEGLEE